MAEPALAMEGVRRRFRQGAGWLEVLSGANLSIAPGERVALVGPSGSGKSTLLQVAGLLDSPDQGSVRVGGVEGRGATESVRTALRRDRIGFVYQFHHLLPELSALENVLLPRMIAGAGFRTAADRAGELLRSVGLGDRMDHRPTQLSGGEQQRVAVCRAIANRPLILLADEPTGNLDLETAESVISMLLDLAAGEGMAILTATHDLGLAGRMDRSVALRRGAVVDLPPGGGRTIAGLGDRVRA